MFVLSIFPKYLQKVVYTRLYAVSQRRSRRISCSIKPVKSFAHFWQFCEKGYFSIAHLLHLSKEKVVYKVLHNGLNFCATGESTIKLFDLVNGPIKRQKNLQGFWQIKRWHYD